MYDVCSRERYEIAVHKNKNRKENITTKLFHLCLFGVTSLILNNNNTIIVYFALGKHKDWNGYKKHAKYIKLFC